MENHDFNLSSHDVSLITYLVSLGMIHLVSSRLVPNEHLPTAHGVV